MVVSVIFDTEYSGQDKRINWFLKNIFHATNQDYIIVTHSSLREHLESLIENTSQRFYEQFEMGYVSADEISRMEICYIPDSLFEEIDKKNGTRTKAIMDLTQNRQEKMEQYIVAFIDQALKKRGLEKPEYILNCLQVFESTRYIAKKYDCPIVPYVFSAVRKLHGYSQTLYMANIDGILFDSDYAKKLYENFHEGELDYPIFSRKEMLALLGKKHNFPLLPLVDYSHEKYKVGIVSQGYNLVPPSFKNQNATDDDIFYACMGKYKDDEICTRTHPMQLSQLGFGRAHMKDDPISFILNSKRVVTVMSQMIIKAALWNKIPCTIGEALPYSFLFTHDVCDEKKINDADLNFIILGYFVPDKCMYDQKYWIWRKSNPTVSEIMKKHIEVIFSDLGIDMDILYSESRLKKILQIRGCDEFTISDIANFDCNTETVALECPNSRLLVSDEQGNTSELFSLNRKEQDNIISYFEVNNNDITEINISLLNDVDGNVKIEKLFINDVEHTMKHEFMYYKKRENTIELKIDKTEQENLCIKVVWKYIPFDK